MTTPIKGKAVKLKNRRVYMYRLKESDHWLMKFKNLQDDGTIGKQALKLTDEAMRSVVGLYFEMMKEETNDN